MPSALVCAYLMLYRDVKHEDTLFIAVPLFSGGFFLRCHPILAQPRFTNTSTPHCCHLYCFRRVAISTRSSH